jgi:outer membrane receptor protein involved in Fe transport
VYGEVLVPILADAAFAKSLNLTLGLRSSDYDTFGRTTNGKVGLEWRPNDQLLVRSTFAEVFRAPLIEDLYGGQFTTAPTFSDPCNGFAGTPAGVPDSNPACINVAVPVAGDPDPDNYFSQTDSQVTAIGGGTQTLTPEQGEVFTWGVVYAPEWLDGFSTTVDVWSVQLDNTIGTYGTQTMLSSCFNSTLAAPSPFCALFSRDAAGELIRVFDVNANVGEYRTNGVDVGFRYAFSTDWGKFRVNVDTTYVDEFDVDYIKDGEVVAHLDNAGTFLSSANGGLGNYSRLRSLGTLAWSMGDFDVQWTSRFISKFKVGSLKPDGVCASVGTQTPPGHPACQFTRGANTYHNLQVGYNAAGMNTKFRLGVDNVFDRQPPLVYQNNGLNGNTDETTFDTVGRYYWMSATVNF